MKLEELQKHWDEFGKVDPLWAILSAPGTEGGRWKLGEFFATGREEIKSVLDYVKVHNGSVPEGSALDFGCGVGRLTQALCPFFAKVTGVDIAPAMLEQANQLNQFPGQCSFVLNARDDLRILEDRTQAFIYTSRVLQHMSPAYSKSYIKDFLRILKPGGILVFQLTEGPAQNPSTVPLPSSNYRAEIELHTRTIAGAAGSKIPVEVTLSNAGTGVWPAFEPEGAWIRLGNHWLSSDGAMLRKDDARAALPYALLPGDRAQIEIAVSAPEKPGSYIVEFDLVHEHVSWFKDRGSKTARVTAIISGAADTPTLASDQQTDEFQPVMEMHGVPKQEVIDLVERNRGKVLNVERDFAAGAEWISYRYCVKRSGRN